MQILKNVLLALLVLMSLGAGVPKIMQMPQELEFLAHLGLGATGVTLLGIVQFAGGILLVPPKTRLTGAVLAVLALGVSAIALVKSGNMALGLITLLPIAIGLSVIAESIRRRGRQPRQSTP